MPAQSTKLPWVVTQGETRLSRTQIQSNLQGFAHRWHEILSNTDVVQANVEQQYAQPFWQELYSCFGIDATVTAIYERYAQKASSRGLGRIDLFQPSVVIGEAKSPGVPLEKAYTQVLDYLAGGSVTQSEMPRYILCHNFEYLRVIRLSGEKFDVEFPLAELPEHVDYLKFLAGYDTVTYQEQVEASVQASKLMTNLFTAMVGDEVDEEVGDEAPTTMHDEDVAVYETSSFLSRILFCLFAEDAGLFEAGMFTRFVEEECNAANLGAQLQALFAVLNTPVERRRNVSELLAEFPYVNGHLFEDTLPTQFFNEQMYEALCVATHFDWSRISPAIFGSLFQLVKSKEARRSDGEHYTSEKNILKVLEPLFLDEFRAEADRLIALKGTASARVKQLRTFQDRLASYVFCDPACGSGNFLVVAYRELRKIETDVIVAIRELEGQETMVWDVSLEQKLSIGQFHGFELNWWPARIAETAMFLVDHQANVELAARIGMAPDRLPISISAHIHHGNALAFDWAVALPDAPMTYIFGNPPFIGHKTKTPEQRQDLKAAWGDYAAGELDYVTAWHAKSMWVLEQRQGEFAFVTTNSIVQGQGVPALFDPLVEHGWRIKFAHRTFAWDSEAPGKAAVHCVIVGFTRDRGVKQQLWDYPSVGGEAVPVAVTMGVNGYLVDGPWETVRSVSKPLSAVIQRSAFGTMPLGPALLVGPADIDAFKADTVASKYLRKFVGAKELVQGTDRWCLWMADEDFDPADLARSALLHDRVEESRRYREAAKETGDAFKYRNTPHLFRPNSRRPAEPYLCIPRHVSMNRRYFTVERFGPEVISGDANFTLPDSSGLQFGLISSSMFITWLKTIGGRIKSDLRFSSTLTWYTFPVPSLTDDQRERIIKAGKGVLEARERHPERSLADHYNPLAMDPALIKAHDALDREVDKAFGAPRKLTTERQRQELLFENYAALTRDV
ncbi:class I SAM-dependent DNA methyltransferase [Corynebacterium afermentans subsp. lipophilum]|uniref:DNA methyltransferase n=1 Tax=Corynebacterium afermentans TaxID=38286 RepID=UPI00188C82AD|nr:DNA methyltransferase [Corynebacterium afermentans]MBF4548317.1 class I SAM-dependent DNA methyltransferase [Corynebacterium afermentans subsp. lipophilum]WJY58332.1 hypothetical protein CAFEL_02740 [Corynebacterium afermentans subsp. lipophilum]